ncbi:MAG: lytic murein transglycosylase [Desulfobacteraceae bacterium]
MERTVWAVICGLVLLLATPALAQKQDLPIAMVDLKYDLIRDGFDRDYITTIFQDERVEFLPKVVNKIAYLKKERRADYRHFMQPEVVDRGRRYLIQHGEALQRAENTFGVSKEVIVAILTVETNLGQVTGRYPVFNVFASLAVMDTPEVIQDLALDRRLSSRLQSKAAWARRELKAFLICCRENRQDPFSLKGSWAGAFGYCQFLPSSLLRCGQDGDGDGQIDIFCDADAIFCIANYLKRGGFKNHRQSTWSRAIHAYNPSDAYVEAVLTLARWY